MFDGPITDYFFSYRTIYQLCTTFALYVIISVILFYQKRHKRHQLLRHYYGIPGPKTCLLDGNFGSIQRQGNYLKTFEEFRQKYGDVFYYFNGDDANIQIFDLDILKQIFFEEPDVFTERTVVYVDIPFAKSILFAVNHRWKFFRKALGPSFRKFHSRSDKSSEFIGDSIKLLIQALEQKFVENTGTNATGARATVDIQDIMKSFSLHLISSLAIRLPGVEVRENEPNVRGLNDFLTNVDRGVMTLPIKFPCLKGMFSFLANNFVLVSILGKVYAALNKTIDTGLAELKYKNPSSDTQWLRAGLTEPQLIDEMIKLHYQGKMSRVEVIGNAEAIMHAGYDTTSTTITYALWALAKHQSIQKKLRSELIAHGTESKYLEQVLCETLRLYPVASTFTTRINTKSITIKGLTIPEGTNVVYNSYIIHRDPKLWPDPLRFDPNRFCNGTASLHPCAYAPFGLGERKCLGQRLAMLEMKMAICDVLVRYQIHLKSPESLVLTSHAYALSEPKDKVVLELEKL